MNGTCVIIKADGTETTTEYDRAPTLAELQASVGGGYIEFIPYFETFRGFNCVAIGDEEAKLKRFPINAKATEHWHQQVRPGDVLVGQISVWYGDDEFFRALTS